MPARVSRDHFFLGGIKEAVCNLPPPPNDYVLTVAKAHIHDM